MSVPLLSKLDEWTVEDLVALPDDGRRYEIVDGSLVVSPAPGIRHEVVVEAVRQVLRQAVPPGLRRGRWTGGQEAVLERPFSVRLVPEDLLR